MSDGVLYVEIMPSTKGIGKAVTGDLDKQLGVTEQKSRSVFGTVAKVGIGAVAAVGAAVGALALGGGISRALNIEDAQAKLKGLGHDAESVQAIMTDALAAVRGTAFGLDAAATVAASAVAAGVKPGQELEKYLKLTADAATIAGVSMSEMGQIINKTTTSGKVFTQELNQLSDRGLPIFQWLQEEYQVSAEELRKMVAAGQVDAETFRKVIEENIGGAALASGDTTRGAFANMLAAFSRLGAVFAGPGLGIAKEFFREVMIFTDGIVTRLKPMTDAWKEFTEGISLEGTADRILGVFDNLGSGGFGGFAEGLIQGLTSAISAAVAWLASGGLVQIFSTISDARAGFLGAMLQAAPGLIDGIIQIIPLVLQGLVLLISQLVTFIVGQAPAILTAAISLLMGLVTAIGQVLPQVIEAIVQLIPVLGEALITLIPQLIEAAVQLFTAIVQAIPLIIPPLIEAIITLIPVLIETILSLIPVVLDAAIDLFLAIVEALPIIIPQLIDAILNLLPVLITTLIGLLPKLIEASVRLFTGLVEALPKVIPKLVDAVIKIGPKIVEAIISMVPLIFNAGKAIIQALIDGIGAMFGAVGNAIGGIMDFIGGFFPRSPAKHGYFAGANWAKLGKSGQAILEQAMSGLRVDASVMNSAVATMTPTLVGAGVPAVYVQNPFTGEYLLSQVDGRADARVRSHDAASARTLRGRETPIR